jgi:Type IV pilin-like G and H, putative
MYLNKTIRSGMVGFKNIACVGAIALMAVGCTSQASVKVAEVAAEANAIESEARSAVRSLLFDQQTYFIENNKFAISIPQLKSGPLTENSNYRYAFTPKPDRKKGIAITAIPKKPNLRSFTGVAFAAKLGKDQMTVTQICETTKPSKKAPVAPATPKRASDKLDCPTGSRNADDIVAQAL